MFEALLRLIGIGVRREPEPDRLAEAQAEARRRARQQWLSLTPEERARSAEMERMLRNAEPRVYSPDQLRPMTEEELARYNNPERARGMRLLASAGSLRPRYITHHESSGDDGPLDFLIPPPS